MYRLVLAGCGQVSIECLKRALMSNNQIIVEDFFYQLGGGILFPWPIDKNIAITDIKFSEKKENGKQVIRIESIDNNGNKYILECAGVGANIYCYPGAVSN